MNGMKRKRKLMKKIYQRLSTFMNGKYGGVLLVVISGVKKTANMIISSDRCLYFENLEKIYRGLFRLLLNQRDMVVVKNTPLHAMALLGQLIWLKCGQSAVKD